MEDEQRKKSEQITSVHACHVSTSLQEKDAELVGARQEAAAAAEEAAAWQRRCKGLQGEADEREVELARRDLRAKVGWALDVEGKLAGCCSRVCGRAAWHSGCAWST